MIERETIRETALETIRTLIYLTDVLRAVEAASATESALVQALLDDKEGSR